MNILHLPFRYFPDAPGGTEIYVQALCRQLSGLGMRCIVAAPAAEDAAYEHDGIAVRRFAEGAVESLSDLYGGENAAARAGFARILDAERPDVVHLHAFTRGVSLDLVRESKKRGIPTVLTYHTPTVSCSRGTMMRWGRELCDGRIDADRCTRCALQSRVGSRMIAEIVGRVPAAAGRALGKAGLQGGVWTALRMRSLIELRSTAAASLFRESDRIVAVCEWVRRVLLENGVPAEKILLCRQGVSALRTAKPRSAAGGKLRIAFLGRLDPGKGLHVLVEALGRQRGLAVELDIYAMRQGGHVSYERRLAAAVKADGRIRFMDAAAPDAISGLLSGYDALAVPSQLAESGPLVVLEAFGSGIPVIGSDLGGIAELVGHGRDGLLVKPFDSSEAWGRAVERLCDRAFLQRLTAGVRPPRQMKDVAFEMAGLYRQLSGVSR